MQSMGRGQIITHEDLQGLQSAEVGAHQGSKGGKIQPGR